MASSDVIELGSSDDETEPVPKKKKPILNAMVHFPNEVPGLKQVKPVLPNLQKVLAGGAVTITNVKKGKVIQQVNKGKPNGKSVQKIVQKPPLKLPTLPNVMIRNPAPISNFSINPLSFVKVQQNARISRPKLSLPPGITVKRTSTSRNIPMHVSVNRQKQNLKRKQPEKQITTVELDDDEVPITSETGPQWYLRPDEPSSQLLDKKEVETEETKDIKQDGDTEQNVNMELENNKEPDTRNYIEITIEDSPIKPLNIKKGFEVGTELPITIDDSPIKPIRSVQQSCASDSDVDKSDTIEPLSKKRLDYPKSEEDSERTEAQNIVEIDLEMPSADEIKENSIEKSCGDVDETKQDMELPKVDTSRRVQTVLITKEVKDVVKLNEINTGLKSNSAEFHPTYQNFIDLCFELENSGDMAKIIEKKIKTYYRQCPKEYVESEEFIDMVSSKIFAMKAAPDKMYLYIKDIVDELNLQRKSAKAVETSNKENKKADDDKYCIADEIDYNTKRRRQIRKLDKTIKKLHRAIQKLEEQEVDFEDEEDSVYLLTERYKERLIRVHAKFCQLTNTKMPSEPRIQIEARPGLPAGPAKRLEKWINMKVPIGTPLPFPDFHDVLRCVRDANEEDRLGWNEADIMEEARDLFIRCGKKLQRRRQENEWRIAAARIAHDASTLDPAEKSDDLKKKLEENKSVAAKKEIELLNKYADKQYQLKLVGEEIKDKEAEESPDESEDDEGNDESNSLENKQKRKERLKRLLHEKTKKTPEKENITREVKISKDEKVVEGEEKMLSENVAQETENKKEDNQEVVNDSDVVSNDPITHDLVDVPSNEQKQAKKNDSDLYDVDSDIDELHLLQKLYSENEINSSTQESDSDTPIATSDSLSDSDGENVKVQQNVDIISIENSSYSESEVTKDEYEMTSEGVMDKNIDPLLLQNAEVTMLSSASSDKLNMDEENILLASSEEENDVEIKSHVDQNEINTCDIKLSNDCGTNIDCDVILNNCNENSTENLMKSNEVPLIENILDNNQHNLELYEKNSDKSNMQQGSNFTVEIENIPLFNKENQDNSKAGKSNNDDVISNTVSCKPISSADELGLQSKTKINYGIDNHHSVENNNGHNFAKPFSDQSIEKVTLGLRSNEKINSENHQDNYAIYKSNLELNVVDEDGTRASKSSEANCTEQNLNKCEVMDVNMELAGDAPSSTEIPTCKDVEIVTSVQCK